MQSPDLRNTSHCFDVQIVVLGQICNFANAWTVVKSGNIHHTPQVLTNFSNSVVWGYWAWYIHPLHCGKRWEGKSMEGWNEKKRQRENEVWCQWGQLVVQPTARQGWNLRLAQPQSRAEGGGRERNTSGRMRGRGREREYVHRGERKQNMQARGRASMQESLGEERGNWRDTDTKGEVLQGKYNVWESSQSLCRGEEGVMCLGREPPREKGEGCEWACSVWTDIGCRLSFSSVSHTNTPSSSDTYHTPGDRKNMAWIKETQRRKRHREKREREGLCLGLSLLFLSREATAFLLFHRETKREQVFVFQSAKDYSSSNSFTTYKICFS